MAESVRLPAPAEPSASPGAPLPPSTTAAQPMRVSTRDLRGIDHDASGTASIYRLPDGSLVVGLEDIDVEPGPDYHVYVAAGADRQDRNEAIYLAARRGNQGTQYYDVPREAGDVGEGWTVLVWCRSFGVPIANVTQQVRADGWDHMPNDVSRTAATAAGSPATSTWAAACRPKRYSRSSPGGATSRAVGSPRRARTRSCVPAHSSSSPTPRRRRARNHGARTTLRHKAASRSGTSLRGPRPFARRTSS